MVQPAVSESLNKKIKPNVLMIGLILALSLVTGALLTVVPPVVVAVLIAVIALSAGFMLAISELIGGLLALAVFFSPFYASFLLETPVLDLRISQLFWLMLGVAFAFRELNNRKQKSAQRSRSLPRLLSFAIVLFVIVDFIGLLFSGAPGVAIKEFIQSFYLMFVFVLVIRVTDNPRYRRIAVRSLGGAAIAAILMVLYTAMSRQYLLPAISISLIGGFDIEFYWGRTFLSEIASSPSSYLQRIDAWNMGPTATAFLLMPVMIFALAQLGDQNKKRRIAGFFVFASGTLALILTGSRAAGIGLLLGILTLLILRRKFKLLAITLFLFSLVISLLLVSVQTDELSQSSLYVARYANLLDIQQDTNAQLRLEVWQTSLNLFLSRPLLGWGRSFFSVADYQLLSNIEFHNVLIQSAAETGILGMFSTLLLLIAIVLAVTRNRNTSHTSSRCELPQDAVIAATMSIVLVSLTMNIYRSELIWVFYGIAVSCNALSTPTDQEMRTSGLETAAPT